MTYVLYSLFRLNDNNIQIGAKTYDINFDEGYGQTSSIIYVATLKKDVLEYKYISNSFPPATCNGSALVWSRQVVYFFNSRSRAIATLRFSS